ncbi:MAG: phospholipase D-like domain-containing protein [Myxococcales bacterium]|nr:phospholipase D-like domain-containing protein [Polyangiaceae bacterium]MDW8249809.1 phospholipase D-like domain-containing protein [Myxococcales bacterium]
MSTGVAYLGDSRAILAACRDLIEAAEHSIVLQMYLFASDGDQTMLLPRGGTFPYADTVAGWLIEKKRQHPQVEIAVILDSNTPSNPALTRRKGTMPRQRMEQAGISVLTANLFGTRFDRRRRRWSAMNFHLDYHDVSLTDWVERQNRWQFFHNVEDHRKNLVIDRGRAGAVLSHNFLDAAHDWHENLIWLSGEASAQLWRIATRALLEALAIPQPVPPERAASLRHLAYLPPVPPVAQLKPRLIPVEGFGGGLTVPVDLPPCLPLDTQCKLVENEEIRPVLLELVEDALPGDELLIATAYFSDLPVLEALGDAAQRGVKVRVLIDSIDALPLPEPFGWLTRSLVNHRVLCRAEQLQQMHSMRFQLRIHESTGGVMMHLKTAARTGHRPLLLGGQANFTPNSFSGAWLETDVLTGEPSVVEAFVRHFELLWSLPASRPLQPSQSRLRSAMLTALLHGFERAGLRP